MRYKTIVLGLTVATLVVGAAIGGNMGPPPSNNGSKTTNRSSVERTTTGDVDQKGVANQPQTDNHGQKSTESLYQLRRQAMNASPAGATATSASYSLRWRSVNSGGGRFSSTHYEGKSTAGQMAIGRVSGPVYEINAGYQRVVLAEPPVCQCPYQCDYDADGFLTALDLAALIDVLFAGRPEDQDLLCRTSRGDFDYDGFPTAIDLSKLIDHLFAGGDPPINPCAK